MVGKKCWTTKGNLGKKEEINDADKRQGRQKTGSKKYTNQKEVKKERHGWEGRKTQGKKKQSK